MIRMVLCYNNLGGCMSFFLPLIYFILTNGLIVLISKKSFGKCIPITLLFPAFIMYFSQLLFKTFKIGFYINLLFPILFIIILFIKYKRKELSEFNNLFFTNGFYSFLIIYVFVFIFDFYRVFTRWDEFSHWGVMVKEMIRLDRFYSVNPSTLMVHKDYPPIIQLFEMFYTRISGGYKEAYLVRSLHLLNFTLFIPIILEFKEKENKWLVILKTGLMIGCMFLIVLFFDGHNVINSIYVDYTMALVAAYLLGVIVFEKDLLNIFTLINLSLGLAFLLLIKQISIALYLMVLFMFIFSLILKKELKKTNIKRLLLSILLLIVIPLITLNMWNNYVDDLHIEKQFEVKDIKISELKGIVEGIAGEEYQREASKNYLEAVRRKSISTSYLKITYIHCFIITMILLYILLRKNNKIFYKYQISLTACTLMLGYIGYFLLMLVLYVFSFDSYEGPSLASFDRYMPTFVLIGLFLIFMMYMKLYSTKTNKKFIVNLLILFGVLVLIQSPVSLRKGFPRIIKAPDNGFIKMADVIDNNTKKNTKVYIIAQDSVGDYQFYIKYYLSDKTTNLNHFNLPVEGIDNYNIYFNVNIRDYMNEYDYLYLAKINEGFINNYSFLFEDNNIKEGNLYKINNSKLELIYENK